MKVSIAVLITLATIAAGGKIPRTFTCPGPGNYPDPLDCGSYYTCANGIAPVHMPCPAGLIFDIKLQLCNTPENAVCASSTTSAPSSTSTSAPSSTSTSQPPTASTSTTTTAAPTTISPTPRPTTPTPDSRCPSKGTTQLENPDDCTSFIFCVDGHSALIDCPVGQGFDPAEQRCRHATEIGCNTDNNEPTPSPEDPKCPSTGSQVISNPVDCSTFFYCHDGLSYLITCPIDYEFDADIGACEVAEKAGCSGPKPSTPKPPNGSSTSVPPTTGQPGLSCVNRPNGDMFPDPTDCSKYYTCSNGAIISNQCGAGLEFNDEVSACDHPENVQCTAEKLYLVPL